MEGGTNDSSNPTKYNVNTPKITLKAPTKLGYKFIEWTNGGIIENGSTGDKSFTAKWEIVTYKITYNLDGGANNKNNPATYNVHDNITLAEPTKTGYKFTGWSDNGKIPVNSTGDKVFTADWEIIGYKITYVLNGGTNSELNNDYYNVENEEIILAAPTRAGYTFNGWSDNGRIPAHSTGDKEFVASWTANQNTLKFNANGGNGGEMPDVTLSTDEEYKLPKNALTRYGYTFAGWSTKADGTVEFEDESVYTIGADSEVTLYAIWSPIETESKKLILGCKNSIIPTDGSVTSIGDSAFESCSKLKSITIPDSVTSIGFYAFNGCNGLKEIHFTGTMEQWKSISKNSNWDICTGSYTIYCSDGSISK